MCFDKINDNQINPVLSSDPNPHCRALVQHYWCSAEKVLSHKTALSQCLCVASFLTLQTSVMVSPSAPFWAHSFLLSIKNLLVSCLLTFIPMALKSSSNMIKLKMSSNYCLACLNRYNSAWVTMN